MSSKTDRDNHSNQLNPNNDAYYSSRGRERSGRDDDEDRGTERPVRDIAERLSRYFAQEEHRRRRQEQDRPQVSMFVGVFVGLDGTTALIPFALSAKPLMGDRQGAETRNEDFAELLVRETGRQLIARWRCPLALQTVLDSQCRDMFWCGYEYPTRCDSRNRVENERQWSEHGEKAVAQVRALMRQTSACRQLQNRDCYRIETDPELARTWNYGKLRRIVAQLIEHHLLHESTPPS
jgi:hypothetical protein